MQYFTAVTEEYATALEILFMKCLGIKRDKERKLISNKTMQQENKNANQNISEKNSLGGEVETEGIYNTTLESELNKYSNTQTSTWRYKKPSYLWKLIKEI